MTTQTQEWKFTAKDIANKPDLFLSGHRACAGCGPATVLRLIMKATRGPTIVTQATGCMEIVGSIYPYTSWNLPWLHTAFENAAANASGIEAALKIMRKKGKIKDQQVDVIALAGDGGTVDIGLQALSGAVERGHDFLFVLYDNEGYMNTGIQRSSSTPTGASTTTTPAGTVIPGKLEKKKPITEIMLAHDMEYVATATPYYWKDLVTKVREEKTNHRNHACPRHGIRRNRHTLLLERHGNQSTQRHRSQRTSIPTCFCPLSERLENRTSKNHGVQQTLS